METVLGKRRRPNRQGTERNVTVLKGCGRDPGKHGGRKICGLISALREDVRQFTADRTESSGSNPSVTSGFAQLSQKSAVLLWTGSTDTA